MNSGNSPTTYTITYNANGGTGAPAAQTKTNGVNLTLSTTRPTRTGYDFLGWSTSSTATTATYQPGASFTTNANTTLYAVWTPSIYTVSYNANGGEGAPASQTKGYGETLTLSDQEPTRDDYIFQGWATSATATAAQYCAGDPYTANSSVTLYAIWESVGSVTGVTITALPDKTEYAVGEVLKTDGLTLRATYSSGVSRPVTNGFTVSGFSSDTTGEKTVTVAFGGQTATFTVTVSPATDWTDWIPADQLPAVIRNAPAGTYELEYADGYQERVKNFTTSGNATLNGWTLYDTQTTTTTAGEYVTEKPGTTPVISGDTCVTKSYQTYYYYYLWAYESGGDPTWAAEDTKVALISAQNLGSNYDKSKLRYIYVYSATNHGNTWPQYSGSAYYVDDNGKSGTITVNNGNIHFYYGGERYKVTTTTTRYYYYQWSAWSDLTINRPAAADNQEIQMVNNGLVRYKPARPSFTYSPADAVAYAEQYVYSRNPAYHDYTTNDCANFVSQCLHAGGIPTDETWCADSTAWIGCGYFYRYFVNNGIGVGSVVTPDSTEPQVGDVLVKYKDDWYLHVLLVVGKDVNGVPLLADHTESAQGEAIGRWRIPFTSCDDQYTYFRIAMNGAALPTVSVSYNAGNGSGAPATQTKTARVDLTLSTAVPTRADYAFMGWNTRADGNGVSYQPGDTFTTDADTVLYAVWQATASAVLGDVNGDGEVDAADASLISRYDAGLTDLTAEQRQVGDVNHDGAVDAADASLISRYDAGLITAF